MVKHRIQPCITDSSLNIPSNTPSIGYSLSKQSRFFHIPKLIEVMGNLLPWRHGRDADPDTAWKQQNKQQKENTLYKFINLGKGGRLVDVYIEEGIEAADRLINTELRNFLYNDGNAKIVRKVDILRWRNKCAAKLKSLSVVDTRSDAQVLSDYTEDPIIKYSDHEVCWSLEHRGGVGETALHLCCLHDTPVHIDIARMFLKHFPKMASDIYEGEEYYGESSLHIAIVYGNFEMVRLLIENGAGVNQRASGRFFLPEDQKNAIKVTATNYEGYAYYGEYPLAFAASFGREEIYDYLIDHGADPNLQDSFGNSVLHMMVITNQIIMFGYAVKHHANRANMELVNQAGLTPLTLASKLGRNDIFKEIIELQSKEIWRYSNITCAKYPLAPLDTIGNKGKCNESSALVYITDGETEEHLEMLEGGVIKQLLDEKWKTYARRRFFERLVLAFLHLICLSIAIYLRPSGSVHIGNPDVNNIVRYIAEIILVLSCLYIFISQLVEMHSQGVANYFKTQATAPAKFIFHISCLLIIACVPFRFTNSLQAETILLSLALPCAWSHLLFFCRGSAIIGPFVIVIYKMLISDIVRFFIIFTVFILQFSQEDLCMVALL